MNKMKLGVTYNLFNGEELLEASINSIRDEVDYINVVWQEYSWTGKKISPDATILIQRLLSEGIIDKLIKFEFESKQDCDYNKLECQKKNLGIKDLRKNECTHFMLMDADEFYFKDEFRKAKEFIRKNNITHSFCSIYDYRVSPNYRMQNTRDYSVSFIFKLTAFSKLFGRDRINNIPCRIDSRRAVPYIPLIHKFYYLNSVTMHHMTGIRNNYSIKMRDTISNHSESGRNAIKKYSNMQDLLESMTEDEILKQGYIKVDDYFDTGKYWKQW